MLARVWEWGTGKKGPRGPWNVRHPPPFTSSSRNKPKSPHASKWVNRVARITLPPMQIQPPTASGEREARELSSANLENHSDAGSSRPPCGTTALGEGGGKRERRAPYWLRTVLNTFLVWRLNWCAMLIRAVFVIRHVAPSVMWQPLWFPPNDC